MKQLQKKSQKPKTIRVPYRETGIILPLIIITGLTFLIYIPALSNGLLLWDDHTYTWQNPFLKNFDFFRVFSFSSFYMGHYHPLTMLWLHMEYLLFPKGVPGMYDGLNPFWFHLNNIVIHLANTSLVFYIIYELKGRKEWVTAAVTALLFGIHPMHVESVAWVSELKDVLYSLFFLASLLVYIFYIKTNRFLILALSFVLFILSDLSKAQAITLPVLFFVIDYYQGRKLSLKTALEKVPFLLLSVFFGILAVKASVAGYVVNGVQTSIVMNVMNGCYSFLDYIFRMFVPVNLCAVHPYSYSILSDLPFWFYLLPIILAGLIFLAFITARRSRDFMFGFLFYAVTISVMLKLVPVGDCLVNERYSYIPYIGLFFIIGQLISGYLEKDQLKYLVYTMFFLIVTACSILSVHRIKDWKDNSTFYEDMVQKYPGFWRGYYGQSVLYYKNGEYDKAFETADKACSLNPPAAPYAMRGTLYLEHQKKYDLAIADFNKLLNLKEKDNHFNIIAHSSLGQAFFNKGDFTRANAEYSKAIGLDPENTLAYIKRGTICADNLGRYDEAMSDFRKVLDMDPSQKEAALGIGYCYYRRNMTSEAISAFGKAIALDTSDGRLYYFRALAFAQAKRFSEAIADGMKSKQLGYNISESDLQHWNSQRKQ
ncbi:MAG: tetratricopeptide repeat protein [Bacteroidetes bacterium]|nr:tetratricopeptide repeat protein [Bacteroidota bacterium]